VKLRFKEDDEIKVFTDPLSPTIDIDPNNKVVESNLRKFEITIEETEKEAEREKSFRKHPNKSISELGDITNSPTMSSGRILGTSGTSSTSSTTSSSESDLIGTSMPKLETST